MNHEVGAEVEGDAGEGEIARRDERLHRRYRRARSIASSARSIQASMWLVTRSPSAGRATLPRPSRRRPGCTRSRDPRGICAGEGPRAPEESGPARRSAGGALGVARSTPAVPSPGARPGAALRAVDAAQRRRLGERPPRPPTRRSSGSRPKPRPGRRDPGRGRDDRRMPCAYRLRGDPRRHRLSSLRLPPSPRGSVMTRHDAPTGPRGNEEALSLHLRAPCVAARLAPPRLRPPPPTRSRRAPRAPARCAAAPGGPWRR